MNYNPLKYKSLIQRTIDKNRANHLTLELPLTQEQKDKELIEYITLLPNELKRLTYQLLDIDTKIDMLLDKYPYLKVGPTRLEANGHWSEDKTNPIAYCLSEKERVDLYKIGFLKPLYQYDNTKRKWSSNVFADTKLFPRSGISCYSTKSFPNGLRGNCPVRSYVHPIQSEFDKFRRSIGYNKSGFKTHYTISRNHYHLIPVLALALFTTTDAYDININYYLRKKGFNYIYEILRYIEPKIKERKERDNRAQQSWQRAKERRELVEMRIQDKQSEKLRAKRIEEERILKRQFAGFKIRFKPTLLLLKKRNKEQAKQAKNQANEQAKQAKVQAKEQAKQAKVQAKEQAKQAKVQAKEQAKQAKVQAKEQAKQAKVQAKELEKFETMLYKEVLKNNLKKRKQLIVKNK